MAIPLETTGLGFTDAAETQLRYTFAVSCRTRLDTADVAELDGLLSAWYTVGAHGGFGSWLNQFTEPVHEPSDSGARLTFTVVGVVTHLALAVLLRCLDVSDIDIVFERVAVDVAAYES